MNDDRKKKFGSDPIGYSLLAWYKWAMVREIAGFPVENFEAPTSNDLKSPILWLGQARAMSECATTIFKSDPINQGLDPLLEGMFHSQYCGVGLMLVGYSLEICIKAQIIMQLGEEEYSNNKFNHHRLADLARHLPISLTKKEYAILDCLASFSTWAGRYPDPGEKKIADWKKTFDTAENNQITARELFEVSAKIMNLAESTAKEVTNNAN